MGHENDPPEDTNAELLKALRGLLAAMGEWCGEWCECSAIQLLDARAAAKDAVARAERRARCSLSKSH